MAAKVEFPIRRKLLLLLAGIVGGATALYLALAIQLFKDDKALLITELNSQSVKTLALEIDATLRRYQDTLSALVEVDPKLERVGAILKRDPTLLVVEFRDAGGVLMGTWASISADWVAKLRTAAPETRGVQNASAPELGPVGHWRFELASGKQARVWFSLADLNRRVSQPGVVKMMVIDSQGQLLAASQGEARVTVRERIQGHPLVQEAAESTLKSMTRRFEWQGTQWVGGFTHAGASGAVVLAQVEEKEAGRAALKLAERSLLIALLVLTISLFASRQLAKTLSDPLDALVGVTEQLSKGNWEGSVHVRTRDEIGLLAGAFNSMVGDLRTQRTQLQGQNTELELKVKERTEALESDKKKLAEMQETLVRTTRLSSLGELAGAAAHEVLNPINNMNIRVQKIQKNLTDLEKPDTELLGNIINAWDAAFKKGGWDALQAELTRISEKDNRPMIHEDLENLVGIARDSVRRLQERADDLDFLAREMIRITRIVNNMRALSRVGGERKPQDIHMAIDATWVAQRDVFERKRVQLVRDYSAEPRAEFQVVADPDELVQVFSNLARNALQAVVDAQRRSGEVRISTRRTVSRVEIRISDNGTGVKSENVGKLFEPNFTTKSLEEGTGLGLSISRRIVRAFGGDIELEETSAGQGTTFLVWFPRVTR